MFSVSVGATKTIQESVPESTTTTAEKHVTPRYNGTNNTKRRKKTSKQIPKLPIFVDRNSTALMYLKTSRTHGVAQNKNSLSRRRFSRLFPTTERSEIVQNYPHPTEDKSRLSDRIQQVQNSQHQLCHQMGHLKHNVDALVEQVQHVCDGNLHEEDIGEVTTRQEIEGCGNDHILSSDRLLGIEHRGDFCGSFFQPSTGHSRIRQGAPERRFAERRRHEATIAATQGIAMLSRHCEETRRPRSDAWLQMFYLVCMIVMHAIVYYIIELGSWTLQDYIYYNIEFAIPLTPGLFPENTLSRV